MSNESLTSRNLSLAGATNADASDIRGILFDKDGTLIDFNRTWLPVYQRAADFLATCVEQPGQGDRLMAAGGYVAADNSWVPDSLLASGSNEQIYRFWLAELDSSDLENDAIIRKEYSDIFHLKHNGYAAVLDDLDGFLATLQAQGLKLGVATMDDEASALQTLESMGCLQRFDFVCGADSGFGVKPDPGMIEAFATAVGLKPVSTMMVGDSPRDLRMGHNAGAGMTVGVLTGASRAEHLRPFADRICEDISGILDFIDGQSS